MKKLLFYLLLTVCAVSCNLNKEKQISQAEFNRLFSHDSIASITLHMGKNEAIVKLKTTGEYEENRVLNIESATAFQDSLGRLERRLASENVHLKYGMAFVSESNMRLLPSQPLAFIEIVFFCTLILFLYAIIDILRNRFESEINKLIWVLVVVFIPFVGPVLYIFIGRKQKRKD